MTVENKSNSTSNTTNRIPGSAISVVDFLLLLWREKITIFFSIVIVTMLGACYAMWVRPQFTSDVLLQVNTKGASSKSTKALGEMGAVLDLASPADAEIELIKSRMVLTYVTAAEHLHLKAIPVGFWDRFTHREGRLDIDEYQHLHRFFIANKETIGSQRSPNTNHCRLWHCCNPGTMRIRQMLFRRNSQEWHMSSHNYNNNI